MPSTASSKVVLIALDSAEIAYLEQNLASLPHLRRLFVGGVVRRLDSDAAVMSGCVWPTFYTGTPPGEHGQYFAMQWDPARMRLRHVGPDWIDCEPFWRPLARRGLPVTTLDVQCVFPSRTPDGVEVINWGVEAFGGFHCNRPEIGGEIVQRFGHDAMGFDAPVDKSPTRLAAMRRQLLASVRRRGELARWLVRNTDWRLFVAVFPECHRAGHYFWPGEGSASAEDAARTLLEVHRAIDEEVGGLLATIDSRDTTVIVFSLLGMTRNRSQMHFVPAVMDRINALFGSSGGAPPHARRNPFRMLRERLPARLQERVALAVPEPLRDWVIGRTFTSGLDWARTPGFALPTGGEGYLRLNLAGREADGCLPRGSEVHRRYLDLVRDGFRSLRVAHTNEPLVEDVFLPSEAFAGPRRDHLPDVAIAWRPDHPATQVRSDRLGTLTGRLATGRGGNHRPSAFAAITGPAHTSPRAESLRTILDLSHFVQQVLTSRPSGA